MLVPIHLSSLISCHSHPAHTFLTPVAFLLCFDPSKPLLSSGPLKLMAFFFFSCLRTFLYISSLLLLPSLFSRFFKDHRKHSFFQYLGNVVIQVMRLEFFQRFSHLTAHENHSCNFLKYRILGST